MAFFDKVLDVLSGGFVKGILDKIPDAGQRAAAELELRKEINRAAESITAAQLDETKSFLADVASARTMQTAALGQEDKFAKRYIYYLTSFIIITSLTYIFVVTFCKIPAENLRVVDTILGFMLGTLISSVISFFYGSTKSSGEKTEQLIKLSHSSNPTVSATATGSGGSEATVTNKP